MGWKSKVKKAKKAHRPYLGSKWSPENLHLSYPSFVKSIDSLPDPQVHHILPHSKDPTLGSKVRSTVPTHLPKVNSPSDLLPGLHNFLTHPLPTLPIYVDRCDTSVEEFNGFYQRNNVPAIIRGVLEVEDWGCKGGDWEWKVRVLVLVVCFKCS